MVAALNPLRMNCSDTANNATNVTADVDLLNAAGISAPNFCGEYEHTFNGDWYETYWCPLTAQCDVYECMFTQGLTNVCTEDYECVVMANPVMIWNASLMTNGRYIVVASDINITFEDRGFNVTYVDWMPPADPYRRICTAVNGTLLNGTSIEMELWGSGNPILSNTCGDFGLYDTNYTLLDEYCLQSNILCSTLDVQVSLTFLQLGYPESNYSDATLCTFQQPTQNCITLTSNDIVFAHRSTTLEFKEDALPFRLRVLTINVTYMNASDSTKEQLTAQDLYYFNTCVVRLIFNDLPPSPPSTASPTHTNQTACYIAPTSAPTGIPTYQPTSGPTQQKRTTVDRAAFISIPIILVLVSLGAILGCVIYKVKHDPSLKGRRRNKY